MVMEWGRVTQVAKWVAKTSAMFAGNERRERGELLAGVLQAWRIALATAQAERATSEAKMQSQLFVCTAFAGRSADVLRRVVLLNWSQVAKKAKARARTAQLLQRSGLLDAQATLHACVRGW